MIIKKLRKQRNWSQDHLSKVSGLSLRTIQRIEGGNKASMESLKALSAVFEINIENLEQEIIVVDKESEQWKKAPLWVRVIFVGSNRIKFKRRDALAFEIFLLVLGLLFLISSFLVTNSYKANILQNASIGAILCAYYMSIKLRMGDKYLVW
jgi:transcriptional regulator with XRE-family HTH domain